LLKASTFAVALLAAGAAGWWGLRTPVPMAEPVTTGIDCRKVHELLPDYLAGRTDAAMTAQIREHLDRCPRCVDALHELEHTGLPQASLRLPRHCPDCESAIAARTHRSMEISLASLLDR